MRHMYVITDDMTDMVKLICDRAREGWFFSSEPIMVHVCKKDAKEKKFLVSRVGTTTIIEKS